jgi:transcription factor IIIB subunit 2
MVLICGTCGPAIAESNDSLGHTVCTKCGEVLEENTIVSQIEFNESSGIQGLSISNNQARQKSSGKFSTQMSSVYQESFRFDCIGPRH